MPSYMAPSKMGKINKKNIIFYCLIVNLTCGLGLHNIKINSYYSNAVLLFHVKGNKFVGNLYRCGVNKEVFQNVIQVRYLKWAGEVVQYVSKHVDNTLGAILILHVMRIFHLVNSILQEVILMS